MEGTAGWDGHGEGQLFIPRALASAVPTHPVLRALGPSSPSIHATNAHVLQTCSRSLQATEAVRPAALGSDPSTKG